MREKLFLLTALCLEAVVNVNVPNEGWYVQCIALQGLEMCRSDFCLHWLRRGWERAGVRGKSWSEGELTQMIFAGV